MSITNKFVKVVTTTMVAFDINYYTRLDMLHMLELLVVEYNKAQLEVGAFQYIDFSIHSSQVIAFNLWTHLMMMLKYKNIISNKYNIDCYWDEKLLNISLYNKEPILYFSIV